MSLVARVYNPPTVISKAKEANEAALLKAQQEIQEAQAGGSQAHCIAISVKWCWWLCFFIPLFARVYIATTLIDFEGRGGE